MKKKNMLDLLNTVVAHRCFTLAATQTTEFNQHKLVIFNVQFVLIKRD